MSSTTSGRGGGRSSGRTSSGTSGRSGTVGSGLPGSAGGTLQRVAKVGYAVSGVLHLLIGVLAVRVALGTGGGTADQNGALAQIASTPFGAALLWLAVVALAALGLWQLSQAVAAGRARETGDAAKSAGKGVVYLALAFTASTFARGGSSSGNQQSQDVTASLLGSAFGALLVGAIGLAIVGVGGYHVYSGATEKFLDNLTGVPPGRAGQVTRWTGRVGYVAKGVALGVLGALFVVAAVQRDATEAGGLDAALRTLGEAPFGKVLIVVVGLGFVAMGVFLFARSRYAKK